MNHANLEDTYRKKENMNNTEFTFRRMYLEEKTQQYIDSKKGLDNYFKNYKGELLLEYQHRYKEYLDLLISMKELGFTRDEIDDYILTHAEVTKEEVTEL